MYYKRFCKTLEDKGILIPASDDARDYIKDYNLDYYLSFFDYTEDQYKKFQEQKTIAGIKDVSTTTLLWDFDDKDDLENARIDAVALCTRLIKHEVNPKDIRIYFSGKKGFCVQVDTDKRLSVQDAKNICFSLASGLKFDKVIYNSNRVIRIKGTRHPDSGLYKFPFTFNQLSNYSIDDIKNLASDISNVNPADFSIDTVSLPDSIFELRLKLALEEESKDRVRNIRELTDLDWKIKPKFLTNCRWALQNGFFEEGMRSNVLTCLAATYKNQGFDEEIAYRMLKGVCELQSKRNNCERFSDGELFNNIVRTVYSDTWSNGQYTCKEEGWLHEYCCELGEHKCNNDEEKDLEPAKITDIHEGFRNYVLNIDKNTIRTGLESLDKKLFISTGSNCLLLGSAGSGKTSLMLNMLKYSSINGVDCVAASLDMAKNRFFEKCCYFVSGLPREELYRKFSENDEADIIEKLSENFGNVNFMHKSCPAVSDLRKYIINTQEKTGKKVKFVIVDYFERMVSELSDEVGSSKKIAGELQDIVNDLDVCLITIVQPNKASLDGGINSPLYDYTSIKGSSFLYQSARQIISLWRDFYNPKDFQRDKYMRIAILKNDLGELSTITYKWDGKRGLISEMTEADKNQFEQWLAEKEAMQEENNNWSMKKKNGWK